ncbi:MAG TPA: DUF4142 domain-containing protein [Candidatus Omnitrophota bacterium]|nr:DUF4142 domain-containing protein [Candidatus Omnitrophota bacterium]
MRARLVVAAFAALLVAGCAQSPSGTTGGTGSTSTSTSSAAVTDKQFVADAASMGLNEVSVGRLAAERASSPQVRSFGRHMAEEHGRNNDRLRAAASQAAVPVPSQPDREEIAKMDKLDDLSGPAFDRAFVNQMVADHQEAVRLFEQQANQGQNPSLRTYATQTLPRLRQHLSDAQALARSQGG